MTVQRFRTRNVEYGIRSFLLFGSMLFLMGCGPDTRMGNDMKNVEERDYATIMLIEEKEKDTNYHFVLGMAQEKVMGEKSMVEKVSEWDAKNLEELAINYGNVTGKDLSLAHLKIILVGGQTEAKSDSLSVQGKEKQDGKAVNTQETEKEEGSRQNRFRREAWLEQLLHMLEEEDEIAKTCPMLELKDSREFIDFLKKEEEPVGNYLESLVRVKERQGMDVPWLKDYLKALRENKEMEVMYLLKVKEGWEIKKNK